MNSKKAAEKPSLLTAATLMTPVALPSSYAASALGSVPLSTSLGPSSSHGPQIFLRVRVEDNPDDVHISTTIPVCVYLFNLPRDYKTYRLCRSAGMYLQEALELVCRKRKIPNPKDYALVLKLPQAGTHIQVPLDRTVASLQGNRELLLIHKENLHTLRNLSKEGRTTDPNGEFDYVHL